MRHDLVRGSSSVRLGHVIFTILLLVFAVLFATIENLVTKSIVIYDDSLTFFLIYHYQP